jgi:signal transduction histidine kinase
VDHLRKVRPRVLIGLTICASSAVTAGFGLSSMRERSQVNGGQLRNTSRRTRGTRVEVTRE